MATAMPEADLENDLADGLVVASIAGVDTDLRWMLG